jgi:hypothetical protein
MVPGFIVGGSIFNVRIYCRTTPNPNNPKYGLKMKICPKTEANHVPYGIFGHAQI